MYFLGFSKLFMKLELDTEVLRIIGYFRCCAPKCKVKELIEIRCESCSKIVCLKHRHPDDHKCVFLKNNGLSEETAMEKAIAVSLFW